MVRKTLIAFLVFVFIITVFSGVSIEKVFGDVEIRGVSVSPSIIDSLAQYTIYIVLHKDLNRGENLYIKFPSECTVPQIINKELVEIAGYKPSVVTVSGNTVTLILSEPLLQNQGAGTGGLAVNFSSSIGIKNPSSPDVYSIEVWSTTEPNHSTYSFYIGIETQGLTVTNLSILLTDNRAGKNAEYDISFIVTTGGALIPGDYIDIFFPKGTVLPKNPDSSKVIVNLSYPSNVSIQDRRVRLYIPENRFIPPGGKCSVMFLKEFGIINPEFTGSFAVQVATSKDTGLATSNLYTLYGNPVEALSISAEPSSQKMIAEYKIEFKTSQTTGGLIKDAGKINIRFASSFFLPSFVKPGAITVNGSPCINVAIEGNTITVFTPIEISSNTQVIIIIKKEFGINNPESVGSFEVFVNTSSDAVYISDNLSITPSTISVPSVTLSNTAAGQISAYNISFTTGISGNLLPGIDRVNVILPVGTTIPSIIPGSTILVNGIPTTLVEISGTTLTITVPSEIKANGTINISITESAGLRNPINSGNYYLYIFTTKETTSIQSNTYTVKNVPQTTLNITPSQPDGLSGFYKNKPIISFSAVSAIDPNPIIYYYFDANTPTVYDNTPINAPEGIHTLYYYAIDKESHREETRSLQIKIDTIPPTISVITPQDKAVLNSFTCIVKGVVDPGSSLKINGENFSIDVLGTFEADILIKSNPEIINITAVDLAGNSSQLNLTVSVDTTPPVLKIEKPVMFEQFSKLPVLVEGLTEPGAKVTVNGISINVNEAGSFLYGLQTLSEGLNTIDVVATDAAGNSTKRNVSVKYSKSVTMILQVGNGFALINGQTYTLEAAPVITSSRTMVPLRFIGEAFGAEFSYEATTKTIDITFGSDKIRMQIGKKVANVNGKEVVLDVAPFIVNGRTLVPIRFISETFGAEVIWESTTKTVTIIYPK